jgi:RimJ/RimL family protein N-acetyltransferase
VDALGDGRAEAARREGGAPATLSRAVRLGEDFVYGVFERDESEVVGGSGLHTRLGEGALEIGYWIRASRVRQGFARETAAALTKLAFAVCGVDRVEIRVDPANEASLGVPRALGFHEEATLRRRLPAGEGQPRRDVVVFSLFAEQLQGTPIAGVTIEAFDALGRIVAV